MLDANKPPTIVRSLFLNGQLDKRLCQPPWANGAAGKQSCDFEVGGDAGGGCGCAVVWGGVFFPVKWVVRRERKRDYGFEDGWRLNWERKLGGGLAGGVGLVHGAGIE